MKRQTLRLTAPLGGLPKFGYFREMPLRLSNRAGILPCSLRLPFSLSQAGYEIIHFRDWPNPDAYVLYDSWGYIVAQWETEPSFGDLLDYEPAKRKEAHDTHNTANPRREAIH